ncbi:MAG: xanthine dehydrogenase family protein molybdopterin-binding subunit, partial [Comamonadaceae bacterium]
MIRRRSLLTGGGLVVLFAGVGACSQLPVIPKRPAASAEDALSSWVRFAGGRYTLFVPRCEMGQNIQTALKQVACDALGVAPGDVDALLPATRDIRRVRATVGSDSIKDFALPLAQACAALRQAIAAGRTEGVIDLRSDPAQALQGLLRERRWTGRAVPIEQGLAIVTGKPLFAADVRRPGQRFARVLRASASPELESTLQSYDEPAARAVPGFVALVSDPLLRQGRSQGLGIVATTPGALDRIEAALAPRWHVEGSCSQAQLDAATDVSARLEAGDLRHTVHSDSIARDGPWQVDLRLEIPLAAHGAIQARAAVAEFAPDGGLSVWAGTQDTFYVRDVLVKSLRLNEAKAVVHACRVGGAFGGKTLCTVELEAAVLARASGAPVQVQ